MLRRTNYYASLLLLLGVVLLTSCGSDNSKNSVASNSSPCSSSTSDNQSQLEASLTLPVVPIRISINLKTGEIGVSLGHEWTTPLGVFELSSSRTLGSLAPETKSCKLLLVVLDNKRVQRYQVKNGAEVKVGFDESSKYTIDSMEVKLNGDTIVHVRTVQSNAPETNLIQGHIPNIKTSANLPQNIDGTTQKAIIDYINAADYAEIQARWHGNSVYVSPFYAGSVYQAVDNDIRSNIANGLVRQATFDSSNSYVTNIRTSTALILVDRCEVWSNTWYNARDMTIVKSEPPMGVPQTITIGLVNSQWFITDVQFYDLKPSCRP